MSLSRIRNRIEALERKLALPLAVVRLRPLALQFCDEMAETMPKARIPENSFRRSFLMLQWAQIILKRMIERGLRPKGLLELQRYLGRCLDRRLLPEPNDVLRELLPKAAQRGLIPRSHRETPF